MARFFHTLLLLLAGPVAAMLGPRFYDWQLSQDPTESWRECELHARNLLGEAGFERLKAENEGRTVDENATGAGHNPLASICELPPQRGTLFDLNRAPLFQQDE